MTFLKIAIFDMRDGTGRWPQGAASLTAILKA